MKIGRLVSWPIIRQEVLHSRTSIRIRGRKRIELNAERFRARAGVSVLTLSFSSVSLFLETQDSMTIVVHPWNHDRVDKDMSGRKRRLRGHTVLVGRA
jgi:hypothetical protein